MRGALTVFSASAILLSSACMAQDLSDQELLMLFQAQRDAYIAAQSGNVGLTRGLTLVTADDIEVTTETPTDTAAADVAADAAVDSSGTDAGGATVEVATEQPAEQPTEAEVIAVSDTGPTVLVKVPEDLQVNVRIEFDLDSAALTPAQKPKLQQLCTVMQAADIQLFRIVGHTDASGSAEYNERLSLLRAQEVQRYFINDCGIAASRLEAVGLGKRFLLDTSDPNAEVNRRVEFQALS